MMKRKKNRKLHGSVLLTVVVVMSLLIVFLFGTLTLATAANNRAHVNYSSAQTNVTSRTVVDAAVKAMTQDPDYADYVMASASASELYIPVQLSATYQGRYGDVVDEHGNSNVVVTQAGKKKFYDTDKKEWADADVLKFTATVRLGGVDSTTSAYVVKQDVTAPSEDGKGGFATVGDAKLVCQTNVYGGTYVSMPELSKATKYNYAYRTDYSDYEVDETNYRHFAAFNESDSNTYVKLEKTGATLEHDVCIYNNLYIHDWKGIIFEADMGLTVWGDLYFHNNALGHLTYKSTLGYEVDAEGHKVYKSLRYNDVNKNGIKDEYEPYENLTFNEIPYFYVDGTISGPGVVLGNKTDKFPLNVFCGNIIVNEPNDLTIAADLYCMNENETSVIKAKNSTNLYSWTGSVVNKDISTDPQYHSASNINTKGSLVLEKVNPDGDVRVEKDCKLNQVTIGNDLYVGKKLTADWNSVTVKGNLYVKERIDFANKEQLNKIEKKIYYKDDGTENTGIYINGVKYEPATEPIEFKVPNDTRPYYQFTPTESQDLDTGVTKYKDVFGNFTLDSSDPVYYRWRHDYDPMGFVTIGYLTANPDEAGLYLNDEADWPRTLEGLPPTSDGNTTYYYVRTRVATSSVKPEDIEGGMLKVSNPHVMNSIRTQYAVTSMDEFANDLGYSMPANDLGDGVTQQYGEQILPVDASANKVQKLTEDTVIYPEYAEKYAILGFRKNFNGKDVSKQVVKTVQDVLESTANPYEYDSLKSNLQLKYDNLTKKTPDTSDDIVYTTHQQIIEDTGKYIESINDDGTYVLGNCSTANEAMNKKGTYIDKDCILDVVNPWYPAGTAMDTNYGKNIIFNPKGQEMLVVIRNFNLDHHRIIIDDSLGGSVNFYIEENCKWEPKGTPIVTTSYMNFFKNNPTFKLDSPNSSGVDMKYASELVSGVSPKVYIYSGKNTKLTIGDFKFMTAYILSPYLDVHIMSTAGDSVVSNISNFYYHDVDIMSPLGGAGNKQFIIGALNANNAEFDNIVNVVYIAQNGGGLDLSGSNYKYNIMYYDEY